MSRKLEQIIADCDADIRAGRAAEAQKRLAAVNAARVPRAFRLPLASLCRRAGLHELGVRLLAPLVVDGRTGDGEPASPAELAEYAVLLQRSGVLDEALKILDGLKPEDNPDVLLFRAYVHFNRWQYYESVPLLRRYLELPLAPYKRLIGRVNLAAALVTTQAHDEALALLAALIEEARAGGHLRLEANCREIRSQIHLFRGRLDEAESDLNEAFRALRGEGTVAEISVLKWRAVLDSLRAGDPGPLERFRARALDFGDWEAVRHVDLNVLRVRFDEALFDYHLFGSPWLGYREIAQRTLGRVITRDHFDYGAPGEFELDVPTGRLNGAADLEVGGKPHRALVALTRDFYRPVPPGALFSGLFPGEYYDVFSSPNRVHQVLFRLRRWIEERRLPIDIEMGKAGYRLRLSQPMIVRVAYENRDLDAHAILLSRAIACFADSRPFTAAELARELELSAGAARRFLAWALEKGAATKSGAGSGTRYAFPAPQIKTA